MDYKEFLSHQKSKIIAPAGYGKTHSLAQCIKHVQGKALILTHTHAGVAAIKDKLKFQLVVPEKYHVETISSFSQKYTSSYYIGGDIPEQDASNEFHSFMLEKSRKICATNIIQDVLKSSYERIFVDEYQDCTKEQHALLQELSKGIPIHIFGDPMQGIFGFRGQQLVDFDNDLDEFSEAPSLSIPFRWNNAGSNGLGQDLHNMRTALQQGKDLDLNNYTNVEIVQAQEAERYRPGTNYQRTINNLRMLDSLLVIHPDPTRKQQRVDFSKRFKGINPIESIDDKDFYRIAKLCDNADLTNKILAVRNISYELFDKTGLDNWFNENGLKNKREEIDKKISAVVSKNIDAITSEYDIARAIEQIKNMPKVRCTRIEIYKSIISAISIAREDGLSIYEAMKKQRNIVRRQGRKIYGSHIGTTLLTKGLEFDTVLILDAHKIKCPKNLYVALTRCCSRLIVITENMQLHPYPI